MSRFGVSLDIGADMDAEEARQKAENENHEAELKEGSKERRELPPSSGDGPVVVSADWKYLVGAVLMLILIVALGWWGLRVLPAKMAGPAVQANETPAATAADVDAAISQLIGDKLANPQGADAPSELAGSSNHDMNQS